MKPQAKIALSLFGLSGLVALVLTGWVAFSLYEITPEENENLESLAELRAAFFRIGDSLKTNFTQLENALKSVEQSKPVVAGERFQRRMRECQQWLDEEKRLANKPAPDQADFDQTAASPGPKGTNQFKLYGGELISLLNNVEQACTNYAAEAHYLIINAGQPWIGKRLAEREQNARYWGSKLLSCAEEALMRGQAIDSAIMDREGRFKGLRDRQELRERIQHLRLILLLVVVGVCFLSLLALYWRKQADTAAVLRQHSEQQARLDKLAHFRSRVAQEHAHEIKQPLTAINAHLYTLQKTLAAGSAAHRDAAVIRSEINRLDQIVEKFLQQARPTEAAPVDLTAEQVLGEVRDLMAPQLEQAAIELGYEVEGGVGFRADPQQLKQVLINLVKNAAESISGKGVISLRARTATRRLAGEAEAVAVLEVEDTGTGISPEMQEKIFEPFFSTKKRGSGLGLAISAGIIDQLGGRLEFDTRVGQGTIFRVVLPAIGKIPIA